MLKSDGSTLFMILPQTNLEPFIVATTSLESARLFYISVESRIRPAGSSEFTPGKLLARSKPNPYPKYVHTPAQKLRTCLQL